MIASQIAPRPISLEKAHRDPGYLKHLKRRPCDCCGRYVPGRMDPAHTGSKNKGHQLKADDKDAITLFRECHIRYHAIGEKAFAEEKNMDLPKIRERVYGEYKRRNAA